MQFCWCPVQSNSQYCNAPFQSSLSQGPTSTFQPQDVFLNYFNSFCNQFLALSQTLNQELAINTTLINLRVPFAVDTAQIQETGVSDSEINALSPDKNTTQRQEVQTEQYKTRDKKNKRKQKTQDNFDEDSYIPEEEPQKIVGSSAGKQSKNIPKNYGKAIVIFIQKNQTFVRRVLCHLNINFRDFMKSLNQAKRKLNSILQLKSLWLDEENSFAKAYRIISLEYLRKYSLPYIFNSRVENYHNHIKYRYRIIESVKDPQNFTVMKEF